MRQRRERHRAAAALREKDERLNLLLENVRDYAVVITDPHGTVVEWLGGAERITGYAPAEATGQQVHLLFTPEDRAAGRPEHEMRAAAATGRAENTRWHQRKDGSRFFADGVTTPLRHSTGTLHGFGMVFRDATRQRHAEDALRQLAADLAEADRRKDEFLATLAHELRNPLAPIRNGLTILAREHPGGDRGRLVGMMDRQLVHLVRLVDDLLDVSRVTTGKVTLRRERVAVQAVLATAVETSRPLVEQAGHELRLVTPDGPLVVDGDPTRLAQVVTNLLNNAAKYTPPGGRIEVSAAADGNGAVVRVSDNGVGIPADMLPRVFDLFTQVGRSIDRAQGGLGIGLSLVRKLVELHDGSVTVESAGPGQGSTFTVRLPLAAGATADPAPPSGPGGTRPATAARRILVVDDNVDAAESLALLLGIGGHTVTTAYSGPDAVAAAARTRPDVVFLDIGLPGMNGYEVAERLRSDPAVPRPVLVALTGWGSPDDRARAAAAGFDHHLTKPADAAQVTDLLARLGADDRNKP